MATAVRLLFTALITWSGYAVSAQTIAVSNEEPSIIDLENLFQKADSVALVNIVSGNADAYDVPIYKAKIVRTFKGAQEGGTTIYFGPYLGNRLGSNYVVFLLDGKTTLTQRPRSDGGYGPVHYWKIFNQGLTSMETSYECVFEGKEPAQSCDYGVRICTDYIKLPKSLQMVPPESNDPPFGCRWARESIFLSLLEAFESLKQ